jgi:hypothetical protein
VGEMFARIDKWKSKDLSKNQICPGHAIAEPGFFYRKKYIKEKTFELGIVTCFGFVKS